jgi:excisionase family DNA binding protein
MAPKTEGTGTSESLLSIALAADYSRVSRKSINRRVQQGHLRPIRLGNSVWFRLSDLKALYGDNPLWLEEA